MRLTIIADGACVCVDGACYTNLDMSRLNTSIHAIQWYGEYGEVEYKSFFVNGKVEREDNKYITDIQDFQWAIDLFFAAKLAQETATATAAEENQPTAFGTQSL
jgi:hypothetical protein